MARCEICTMNTKEQRSSEAYDAMKKVSGCNNESRRHPSGMMSVWEQYMEETVPANGFFLFPDSEST